MTDIHRLRSTWSGFSGQPGVTTMYFLDTADITSAVHGFWDGIKTSLPPNVVITIDEGGDTIDDATGDLVGAWTGEVSVAVTGTGGGGAYAAPVGASIVWHTLTIADGSRVRGRSYLVPLEANQFAADGTLNDGAKDNIALKANDMITASGDQLVVWHRPFAGRAATETRPAKPAHAGSNALVTTASVADKAVVLRSRRD